MTIDWVKLNLVNTFARDVTQKRAAEEQLIQAQKMEAVGQLTGTIEILADAVKNDPHLSTITNIPGPQAGRTSPSCYH